MLLAYLVQAKAKDWKDGLPLSDLAIAKSHMYASHSGDLSVHHILPRKSRSPGTRPLRRSIASQTTRSSVGD